VIVMAETYSKTSISRFHPVKLGRGRMGKNTFSPALRTYELSEKDMFLIDVPYAYRFQMDENF